MANINGVNFRSAALEQAIGESTRRSANIGADEPTHVQLEVDEGALQLVAPARHESLPSPDLWVAIWSHESTGLIDALGVYEHFSGQDKGLSLRSTLTQALLDQ